jgi:hypothetical protein
VAQAHLAHIGDSICVALHQAACQAGLHVSCCHSLREDMGVQRGKATPEPKPRHRGYNEVGGCNAPCRAGLELQPHTKGALACCEGDRTVLPGLSKSRGPAVYTQEATSSGASTGVCWNRPPLAHLIAKYSAISRADC